MNNIDDPFRLFLFDEIHKDLETSVKKDTILVAPFAVFLEGGDFEKIAFHGQTFSKVEWSQDWTSKVGSLGWSEMESIET